MIPQLKPQRNTYHVESLSCRTLFNILILIVKCVSTLQKLGQPSLHPTHDNDFTVSLGRTSIQLPKPILRWEESLLAEGSVKKKVKKSNRSKRALLEQLQRLQGSRAVEGTTVVTKFRKPEGKLPRCSVGFQDLEKDQTSDTNSRTATVNRLCLRTLET